MCRVLTLIKLLTTLSEWITRTGSRLSVTSLNIQLWQCRRVAKWSKRIWHSQQSKISMDLSEFNSNFQTVPSINGMSQNSNRRSNLFSNSNLHNRWLQRQLKMQVMNSRVYQSTLFSKRPSSRQQSKKQSWRHSRRLSRVRVWSSTTPARCRVTTTSLRSTRHPLPGSQKFSRSTKCAALSSPSRISWTRSSVGHSTRVRWWAASNSTWWLSSRLAPGDLTISKISF